jgi:hypothetical protein
VLERIDGCLLRPHKKEKRFLFFYRRARTNETNERRKRLRGVPVKEEGGAAAAGLDDVSFNENPTPGPAPKIEAEISTQLV